MKLAISNLAWDRGDDFEIAGLLRSMGINGVEIAPTKIWEKPLDATDAENDDYRQSGPVSGSGLSWFRRFFLAGRT